MSWLMAFALGSEGAYKIITSTIPTETVSTEFSDIDARVVRGGEKGILLFSIAAKKLTFLQWGAIKKIDTVEPK
jgi:hypothetical protein